MIYWLEEAMSGCESSKQQTSSAQEREDQRTFLEKEILLQCLQSVEKWSCHSEIANPGRKIGLGLWGDDTFI